MAARASVLLVRPTGHAEAMPPTQLTELHALYAHILSQLNARCLARVCCVSRELGATEDSEWHLGGETHAHALPLLRRLIMIPLLPRFDRRENPYLEIFGSITFLCLRVANELQRNNQATHRGPFLPVAIGLTHGSDGHLTSVGHA